LEIKEKYNPDLTRNQILEAAFKEIYVHGFQAASLNRILKNMNHTKGALYHHFSSKKKLGLSVIEEMIGVQMYAFFMAPLEDTDNPIPVLCDIIQRKIDTLTLQEIKYGCPLNNLTQEMASIDDDFYQSLKIISDKWVSTIEQSLNRGKVSGNVNKEVDTNGASLFIVASIEGAFGLGKTTDSDIFFKQCMKQLQNFIKSLE